ncbi:hypothetical protein [Herbaspirillum sp. ST 5-3]|uniref:hypothetical protein n=1 Tax=Oxalobacteraceae TaxID=75682 RepID=UPI0010A40DAA|nr:hypothetical protein [Herbaspirillum sp. ST 5-3]
MIQTGVYNRIFDYPPENAASLVFVDPDQIEHGARSSEVAAWELLLGAMQLRRVGQQSSATDWLNHASHLSIDNDVFKAELLGEAGHELYTSDRLQDALKILNSAAAIWRDACAQAAEACAGGKKQAAAEFASHLLPLFAAAKLEPPASEAAIRKGAQATPVIRQWLVERAVIGRAQTANDMLCLLAKAGRIEDARRILREEMDWIALDFTSPPKTSAKGGLNERNMSPATRRALYLLLLAQGEIEIAADAFQKSADSFAEAAAIYENKVEDDSDIERLLRAKFNQANSLLRLKRYQEALDIYALCEQGFNSIGRDDAAQRVKHARLFVQTKALDDDAS